MSTPPMWSVTSTRRPSPKGASSHLGTGIQRYHSHMPRAAPNHSDTVIIHQPTTAGSPLPDSVVLKSVSPQATSVAGMLNA